MNDEQQFLDAVERFGQELLGNRPDLVDRIEEARRGVADPKEVVKEVWKAAAEDSTFTAELEYALFKAFEVDPGSTDLAHFPDRQKLLDRWGFTDEDLIFQPFADRPDYKMLHPLLMGMIVELLQFDGDVPELRTGRLPEGGSPAVPVKTTVRDPVVIGAMLRRASDEVAEELALAQTTHDEKIAKMLNAAGESKGAITGLVRQETERGVGVPGYRPGHKAQMREVIPPTASELAKMPFEERQELAHKALTSTQGRRTAVPVIGEMVLGALRDEGFEAVRLGEGSTPVTEVEWVIQIDGGQNERNPNFNFVETAALSLSTKLRRELGAVQDPKTEFKLKISPVNLVSERRVGWRAILST